MPFPLNQITNRFPIELASPVRAAESAAYAVPVELNIEIRGGTPTITGSWAAVRPFRKIRRDRRVRLVITCDMSRPPWIWKFPQFYQSDHQLFKPIVRFPKRLECPIQYGPVSGRILPSGHIPEELLDHAFLALRRPGQELAEFSRAAKIRSLNSGHPPFRIQ